MSYSQNLIIRGVIKERIDKFDKKGNIKENDFDIADITGVKISLYTKDGVIESTKNHGAGEYSLSADAAKEIYYLKIEKKHYLPKISELDLRNFSFNEILELNDWDFGIRKNLDNVTSPILEKPFEKYYYDLKSSSLVLDEDYGYEYQIAFSDAVFTQIEEIQKETVKSEETNTSVADAKKIINSARIKANQMMDNARDLRYDLISKKTENPKTEDTEALKKKINAELKIKYQKWLATEKERVTKHVRDSIFELVYASEVKEEEKEIAASEDGILTSKKFELYAKKQQLEIDRLKALTKEDSLIIQLREEEINSVESEILSAESRIQATKAKLEAEHKELLLKDSQNKNQQNIIIIISLIILVILVATFFIYRNLHEKRKTADELLDRNLIIAEKNESILSSIKYAKRIQDAILPRIERWNEAIENSFILYMPKDIVSGDFYWMHEFTKKEVLFAAVDCTGHGVPGGFMSIVGYYSLHRAVNEFGFKEPAKILDSMQKSVNTVLRQGFGEGTIKDGMDMALCCLNKETRVLQYSGAYNPLWILRDGEILETKATKQAVGTFTEHYTPFVNHEIQLQEGDTIFIFSDGYSDQFGGLEGKKIMNKGLKKLLIQYRDLSLNKQKIELKKHFYEWMNDGEDDQVDDVCIIGVRV